MQALILYAHGARDPQWAEPVHAIGMRLRQARPEWIVLEAYLEYTAPDLMQAVAEARSGGATAVTLVPLFLGRGGHLLRDFPGIVERVRIAHPGLPVRVLPSLGEVPEVLDAIAAWIAAVPP